MFLYSKKLGVYNCFYTDRMGQDAKLARKKHIKFHTLNGKSGLSVLSYARLTLNIALSGDRETYSRFVNGGTVRGIVSNDKSVTGFGEYQDKELEKTAGSIDGL